jgi:hypothetical protein
LVSPGFTKTNLNGYAGTESVEDGSRGAMLETCGSGGKGRDVKEGVPSR